MSTDPYRWHYDYIRLAWDMGFSFESHKSQKNFDRNGIAVLDIDRIIHDRDISIVEHHIQNILEYSLDIEEARILDPNFVKLFRLSQLAVEYLMYCKKYLDNTVVNIKNDLQKSNEENNELKQVIMNYQLEVSKMKKKNKDLKTALQIHEKYQVIGTVNDPLGHFQCSECGKVFVHEDYLKAHIIRRHAPEDIQQISEIETALSLSEGQINTTPVHSLHKAETDRLQMEIKELKEKLINAERYFQSEEQNKNVDCDRKIRDIEIQNEDYYKHIEKLHQQFDILKTEIESELQVLKVQKSEQDKYNKLIEKIFDKFNEKSKLTQLVEKKPEDDVNEPKIVKVTSKDKETNPDVSEKETDDLQIDNELDQNNVEKAEVKKVTLSPQKQSAPRLSEGATRFFKTSESPSKSEKIWTDISKVKEQVEKELEKKTKHDIEKLGVQLSEQMTNTVSKLQDRLEIFWDKLQEIEYQHEKQRISLKTVDLIKTTNTFQKTEKITVSTTPIQNSSDSHSDTESIKAEKQNTEKIKSGSTTAQIHNDAKYVKNLIDELKSKVQEKKKEPPKIYSKKPKIITVQPQPSIRENYLRKMFELSDSESEIETSENDTKETESPAIIKPSKTVKNLTVTVNRPKKITVSTEPIQNSSDYVSDTESIKAEKQNTEKIKSGSTTAQIHNDAKYAKNLIDELKSKVQEKKKKPSKINSKKPKFGKIITVQPQPSIRENYSREMIEQSNSESERETSENDTEETESSAIMKPSKTVTNSAVTVNRPKNISTKAVKSSHTGVTTLRKRSIRSLENALIKEEIREEIKDVVSNRLRDIEVDPEWTRQPEKSYKQEMDFVTHHRTMASKNIKSFSDKRNKIIDKLEGKMQHFKLTDTTSVTPEPEQKPSKFRSLISNMKNRAKSIIKTENKPVHKVSGIYKLTVYQNLPQSQKSEPEKHSEIVKQNTTNSVNKNVPKAKPRERVRQRMYKSESDTETSTENLANESPTKTKKLQKKSLRKTKLDSSLDVVDVESNDEKQTKLIHIPETVKNIAQSFDSILEKKRELSAAQQRVSVHQVSGIYKRTVHQNLPQSQKSEPEKHSEIVKQKTTNSVNKNVPKAKPRERVRQRMFKSESDTETSTENLAIESPTKTKKLQKKSLRKTKLDSSLDVVDVESNDEKQTKLIHIPETVKNIAQSFDSILEMKQELSAAQQRVSVHQVSGIYKRTVHQNLPQSQKSEPEKHSEIVKQKTTNSVNKNVPKAKPRERVRQRMFKSESDTETSTENLAIESPTKTKKLQKKSLRKTKLDSSLDVVDVESNDEKQTKLIHIPETVKNIAQSFDSILEMKQELSAAQQRVSVHQVSGIYKRTVHQNLPQSQKSEPEKHSEIVKQKTTNSVNKNVPKAKPRERVRQRMFKSESDTETSTENLAIESPTKTKKLQKKSLRKTKLDSSLDVVDVESNDEKQTKLIHIPETVKNIAQSFDSILEMKQELSAAQQRVSVHQVSGIYKRTVHQNLPQSQKSEPEKHSEIVKQKTTNSVNKNVPKAKPRERVRQRMFKSESDTETSTENLAIESPTKTKKLQKKSLRKTKLDSSLDVVDVESNDEKQTKLIHIPETVKNIAQSFDSILEMKQELSAAQQRVSVHQVSGIYKRTVHQNLPQSQKSEPEKHSEIVKQKTTNLVNKNVPKAKSRERVRQRMFKSESDTETSTENLANESPTKTKKLQKKSLRKTKLDSSLDVVDVESNDEKQTKLIHIPETVKNIAQSFDSILEMKQELSAAQQRVSVHQVSGIYKRTVHQNLPQSQKSEPEKHSEIVKQKTTNSVNKNVPKAKSRERVRQRMYKSESDTETLTKNLANESPTKTKKLQKKSLRKTKLDSSLDVVDIESNHENQTKLIHIAETVKNMAQSLDRILEMKQELSADSSKSQQRVSDKSESLRKTKLDSSLDVVDIELNHENQTKLIDLAETVKNMAQSLDRILEMKQELSADSSESQQRVSDKSESLRKTKLDSSLDVVDIELNHENQTKLIDLAETVKNMAQSLDSILEMKQELSADSSESQQRVSDKSESSSYENILSSKRSLPKIDQPAKNFIQKTIEFKEKKMEKSVLKNYTLTKKKILFDPYSEDVKTNSEENM